MLSVRDTLGRKIKLKKKKSPNGKIITGNMQDNREKNACRGQKDEMHVSAVLDLFILD